MDSRSEQGSISLFILKLGVNRIFQVPSIVMTFVEMYVERQVSSFLISSVQG